MEVKYVAVIEIIDGKLQYADDILYSQILTPKELDECLIEILEERIKLLKARL